MRKQKEDLEVKTRYPIGDPIKHFFNRIGVGSKRFFDTQIPSAANNLKSWVTSFRGGFILTFLIILIVVPPLINDPLYYHTFIVAMIYSIFSASWDILAGVTGQVSFGHSAFFGMGGYVFALFTIGFGVDWFTSIFISAILTVLIGLIIAIPSLRLKGPYLALGTLAFSLALYYIFQFPELHVETLYLPQDLKIWWFSDPLREFFIILLFMIVSVVIMLIIFNSRLGTVFKGIRDNEYATEASGINTTKYKLIAFMISSFFAGLAGTLYSLHYGTTTFLMYSNVLSFYPVVFTILGGIASISGAVMGAFTFVFLVRIIGEVFGSIFPPAFMTYVETFAIVTFAIILVIIIRFSQFGIMEPLIKNAKKFYDILLGK
jgi:branched-chain amino acid transport system permease protein